MTRRAATLCRQGREQAHCRHGDADLLLNSTALAGILPQSKGQAQGTTQSQTQSDAMEIDRVVSGVEENADETPDREGEGREGTIEAGRDLLGEMEISARLMITGGDAHEDARLTRADRWLIQQAILGAVEQVRASGRGQMLTEDVAHALRAMATERPNGVRTWPTPWGIFARRAASPRISSTGPASSGPTPT